MNKTTLGRSDFYTVFFLFVFFFTLYLTTLCPDIMFEDSGEFALSSVSLGVSHPPGYPLFNLIGRLFQALPMESAGFRISLMSAFLGALGITILYAAARGFGFSLAASFIGSAVFGLSRTLWSQASIVEVYTLNTLLNASLLLGIARLRAGDKKTPVFLALLLGLTSANHYTTLVAFAPLLMAAILWTEGSRPKAWAGRLTAGLFVAASMASLYLLIPLRAAGDAILNWRDPETWPVFIEHIKRTQFSDWENQLRFDVSTLMYYLGDFVTKLPVEFFGVFIFIGIFGAAYLLLERFRLAVALIWLWLVQSLGILLVIRFHADDAGVSVVRVFYIGAYMIMGILIAAGSDSLLKHLGGAGRPWARIVVCSFLLGCLAVPLVRNHRVDNLSGENRFIRIQRDIFRYLPRDAVYYLNGAEFTSPAMYVNFLENLRPDVTLIESSGNLLVGELERINGSFDWINIETAVESSMEYYHGRRPQALSYPRNVEGGSWVIAQRGPIFVTSDSKRCDLKGWSPESYRLSPESLLDRDYETRILAPILYSRVAECEFMNNDTAGGLAYVRRAVAAMPDSAHVNLFAGQLLDRYDLKSEAINYYIESLKRCPTYTDVYLQLGNMMIAQKEYTAAEEYFDKALEISPGHIQARVALANIARLKGDSSLSAEKYEELLQAYPNDILLMNNLSNVYMELRRISNAGELLRNAMRTEPHVPLTVLNYSGFLIELGRLEEARDVLEDFLKRRPNSAYGHYNLSVAMQRMGDHEEAIVHLKKSVVLAPRLLNAWSNLIIILLDQNRIDEARAVVEQMRRTAGDDYSAQNYQLYLKVEQKAIEINPDDAQAWSNYILGFLQIKKYDKAIEALRSMKAATGDRFNSLGKILETRINAETRR